MDHDHDTLQVQAGSRASVSTCMDDRARALGFAADPWLLASEHGPLALPCIAIRTAIHHCGRTDNRWLHGFFDRASSSGLKCSKHVQDDMQGCSYVAISDVLKRGVKQAGA